MKTWAKVLIGVLVLTNTFQAVYCFIINDEAAKQEAAALMASESAEKAMQEATLQAEFAEKNAAEARRAQSEAAELMVELENCKSKK